MRLLDALIQRIVTGSAKFVFRIKRACALLICLATFMPSAVRAEDKKPRPQSGAVPAAVQTPTKNRYQVPDGGVQELLAFVKDVQSFRPTTPQEVTERRKAYGAVEAALEKIWQTATDEDKKLPGFQEAADLRLVFRTIIYSKGPRAGTVEEKSKLRDEIRASLKASPTPSANAVSAAMKVAVALQDGEETELAVEVFREFGRILVASPDKETVVKGLQLQGAARRLSLVGRPLQLGGTLMDGTPLDWAQYRGKVVLVECWATWCVPCVRELPNVRKNFDDYHDRGFEVIAIGLDEDRAALDKFFDREKHPWPTLFDGGPRDSPFALYYGLMGPSATILVDKEGKVVSLNARGPELGKQLSQRLGPPTVGKKERPKQRSEK